MKILHFQQLMKNYSNRKNRLKAAQKTSIKYLCFSGTYNKKPPFDYLSGLCDFPSIEFLSVEFLNLKERPIFEFNLLEYFHCQGDDFNLVAYVSLRRLLLNSNQLKSLKLKVTKITNMFEIICDHPYFRGIDLEEKRSNRSSTS